MQNNSYYIIFITAILIVSIGCKKSPLLCSDEKEFCKQVNDTNWVKVGEIMNDYLKLFKKKKKDELEGHKENLEKFEKWLECKECVNKATIGDVLIQTAPPQVEFKIEFSNSETKVADISLDNTLKFLRFH
ncbi:MAG: hypothetical protein IIA88_09110, partial [Bacteroidetes bacterium]|nr:hypothetical protein [Bacteroidota bacterium]